MVTIKHNFAFELTEKLTLATAIDFWDITENMDGDYKLELRSTRVENLRLLATYIFSHARDRADMHSLDCRLTAWF